MSLDIHYYDEEPAWKVVVADPERFRGVNYDLEIKLFRMPKGGLVAYWLRLYDVADQPFFLHRVLDPTDAAIGKYLNAVRSLGKIVLVFESPGRQGGFAVELPVNAKGLGEVIDGAVKHTEHLGDEADGRRTVEDFLGVFTPALEKEKSVSAAWDEVQRRLPYRPPRGSKERPAAETWSGIGGLVLATALCVFAGAGARRLTPYAANKYLETRIVRPGYGVKLYLGDPVRSIGARWRGESPRFDLEVGDPAFVDSVVAHADVWDADITEMRSGREAPPSFRPMMEIRLKDDPHLSGQTLIGTASLTAVYPTFSGVAFREASLPLDKKIEIRVFTFPQVLLARAAPLFYTAGAILVILTVIAMIGRLRCEETGVSPGE